MRSGLGTRSPYSSCWAVMRFQFLGKLQPSSPVSRDLSAYRWRPFVIRQIILPGHQGLRACIGIVSTGKCPPVVLWPLTDTVTNTTDATLARPWTRACAAADSTYQGRCNS